MDNGGITAGSTQLLRSYYHQLPQIFNPYKFELQKFVTNERQLQSLVDSHWGIFKTKRQMTPVTRNKIGLAVQKQS